MVKILLALILFFGIGCSTGKKPISPWAPAVDEKTCSSSEARINYQIQLFEAVQDPIRETIVKLKLPVDRKQFERWLTPPAQCQMTLLDREVLSSQFQRRISQAKAEAVENSKYDFDQIRKNPKRLKRFCREVPKGALLHTHGNGNWNRSLLIKTLRKYKIEIQPKRILKRVNEWDSLLYPSEIEFLRSLPDKFTYNSLARKNRKPFMNLFFLPPGTHDFKRFEAVFVFISELYESGKEIQIFRDLMMDYAGRAKNQGYKYLEVTKGVGVDELTDYDQLANDIFKRHKVYVKWNKSFYRIADDVDLRNKANRFVNTMKSRKFDSVVGINLLGNEKLNDALSAAQHIYPKVLAANLGELGPMLSNVQLSQHAGELGEKNNVRDALILGVHRIGHGTNLVHSPIVMEWVRRKKVPIEIAFQSNVYLRAITSLEAHPVMTYLRLGIPVSLSTDDAGVFQITENEECEFLIKNTDIQYSEFIQMMRSSIEHSFFPAKEKWRLFDWWQDRITRFEKRFK